MPDSNFKVFLKLLNALHLQQFFFLPVLLKPTYLSTSSHPSSFRNKFEHRFQDVPCLLFVFHQKKPMSALHNCARPSESTSMLVSKNITKHPYRRPFHQERSRSTSSSSVFFHKSAGFISERNKKNRFKKSSSKDSKRYLISPPLGDCINNVTSTSFKTPRDNHRAVNQICL